MRLNSELKILGDNVILVPYRKHHVPKYHDWMKSEELQILTASEALTLEEEYKMQETWLRDDDKCTFIILDKKKYESSEDEVGSMIGDTNIFLTRNDEHKVGEIEIMIAEREFRGRKLGWESVILMLLYGIEYINLNHFEAKISTVNQASISMFEKLLFRETSRSEIFKEVTLERPVNEDWIKWLLTHYKLNLLTHTLY